MTPHTEERWKRAVNRSKQVVIVKSNTYQTIIYSTDMWLPVFSVE